MSHNEFEIRPTRTIGWWLPSHERPRGVVLLRPFCAWKARLLAVDAATRRMTRGRTWLRLLILLTLVLANLRAGLLTSTPAAAAPSASFATQVRYTVGTVPHAVAVGDFNGDGTPDLVAANVQSNSVSILLGTGSGTFGAAQSFAAGLTPESVAIDDFNRDGKLDLAVADANSHAVSILLGTRDSTLFGTAQSFAVGSTPFSIATGDFNGDGKPDLAVADQAGNAVDVLLGTGIGTFTTAPPNAVGTAPHAVAVGDFNGDGKLDLATANQTSGTVTILQGVGNGTFLHVADIVTGPGPTAVAFGAFSGIGGLPGWSGLAVTNGGNGTVTEVLPTPLGGFASPVTRQYSTGSNPYAVTVGDFTGDGVADLAAANRDDNTVSVLVGFPQGGFDAQAVFATGSNPVAVAAGDFNRDGKLDLATANFGTPNSSPSSPGTTVSVLLNTFVDGTPPLVRLSTPVPVFGQAQWFNERDTVPVPVQVTADDTLTGDSNIRSIDCTVDGTVEALINTSGLGSKPTASGTLPISGDGAHQIICTATDTAGNTSPVLPGLSTGVVRIDGTPPTNTPSATSGNAPYDSGTWTDTPVTVSFGDCTDATSGVASVSPPVTISTEGANQSATGICADSAGNTSSATVSGIDFDQTPPLLSGAPTSPPNGNGWYQGDVTIGWTCSDALSGISGSCPANSTITGEGVGLTASASVSDQASNTAVATTSPPVNIDRTPPVTTSTAPTGWNNTAVSLTLTADDTLSGVQETDYTIDGGSPQSYQSGATLTFSTEGTHTLQFWSVDKAGNSETPHSVEIKIDKTSPTISNTTAPAANSNGWNNSSVTVTFTCADALSGVQSCDGSLTSPGSSMLSTEGLGQLLTGVAVDSATNTATDPVILNIDETAPSISGTIFPAPNANGWNNSAVNIAFTCMDPKNTSNGTPGSGIAGCSAPMVLHSEGTGQSVTGTATDGAGNTNSTTVSGINIDLTRPTITASAKTADGTPYTPGAWTKQAVTVTFSCSDALSGIASCPAPVTYSSQGSYVASGPATDKAGNIASVSIPVNIDETAPTITGSAAPGPNANGWNNGTVTVSFTCGDTGGSGIVACPSPTTLSLDRAGQSVTGTATDAAGNNASATVSGINIDKTAPTITLASRTPAANANGWNNGPVTVTWSCADSLSGPASPSVSAPLSMEGANQSATGTCSDKAGNTTSATQAGINIDLTPPSLAPTVSPNPVLLNGTATASPTATDGLSGIATQSCAAVATSSVGNQTVTCSATDRAGNTASKAASYAVAYAQKLLYNTTTQYKSGSSLPITLQLQDAKGTNVSSAGITVTAVSVVNSSGTVVNTINAPFIFSKSQAQFTYSLNTAGLTTGSYNLRFTAGSDPTTHLAPFSIK